MSKSTASADIFDRLYEIIETRRDADPKESYVAKLAQKGRLKIAQKLGEEAVETALAAVGEGHDEIVAEAGDLLFHLIMLLVDCGISLDEVRDELAAREGISGLKEKASRGKS
ncbi:MAG: phosphoribosyl-ATP diphosphatase [Pseudomonadota bacterium]